MEPTIITSIVLVCFALTVSKDIRHFADDAQKRQGWSDT